MSADTLEVLGTGDAERWIGWLERLPADRRDVYFTPGYARLYEGPDRRARCLAFARGGECLLHVFIERRLDRVGARPLARPALLAESVYGYGGPISSTADGAFLAEAHAAVEAHQRAAGIVSEFVRFHPLLRNEGLGLAAWRPALDRYTVALRLDGPGEGWRREYEATQRNRVRRAESAGVTVAPTEDEADWHAFTVLYRETMARIGAAAFYHFDEPYFAELRRGLGERVHLFVARWQGRLVAGAVIMTDGPWVHHHLSGSARDAQGVAPNNLLFDTVARWGAARGHRWLHLGGGRSGDPADALLRFKARFARPTCPFYLGRGVYDEAAHQALREGWLAAHPDGADLAERIFQVYALEEAA